MNFLFSVFEVHHLVVSLQYFLIFYLHQGLALNDMLGGYWRLPWMFECVQSSCEREGDSS